MTRPCCVCLGRCDCMYVHHYCHSHFAARGPFAPPEKRFDTLDYFVLALAIAFIVTGFLLSQGCAVHPAPEAAPEAAPVVLSQPASIPSCVQRATFDKLAAMYVGLWQGSGKSMADCTENSTILKADRDAESARADAAESKLTLVSVLGPTTAAALACILTWVAVHFSQPKPAH